MKPKSYTTTAANMSPFLGPKQLDWLSDTNEFIYRVIYFPLINREDFDIYSDVKSRPGTPPEICLSWLCLKDQYHVSHEVALQNLRFNLAWQLATGTLYMGDSITGCEKTISRFEERCAAYAVNNDVQNPIAITSERFTVMSCALAGIDGRLTREDSTPVSGNFTVRSREELLYLAISAGASWITCSEAPEQVEALNACSRLDKYKDPIFTLNRVSDRWPASQDKRREMLCLDADALLEIYHMGDSACKSKTIWETVIEQQTKLDDQEVRVFAEKGDPQLNGSVIQSLLDAEATYRWKNGRSLWGYVIDAVETANSEAHFIISSCLYPNNKIDADMSNELNQHYKPFFEKVDAIYEEYPSLKKGDPVYCQDVVQSIVNSLKKDFVAEGEKLYQMSLADAPVESLTDQLNKQIAVLDSFYGRLGGFDPGTPPVTSQAVQPNPSVSTSAGAEDAGKAPCSRAVEDWSRNGEDPVQMDSPDFALLSEGERRNIILNRIAELNGLGETCFAQERNRIVDGAYSPAAEFAKELGITMLTTNLLGKKGNAITVLFNLDPADGGKPTCPLGKEITKTSTRANGSICVWMNQNHCSECPCNKDCGVKYQKRGELGTITLNPNTFQAIVSEALILTDRYQKFADFRNGSEALMSLFHNFHRCDRWPIGMDRKRRRLTIMTIVTNIRNLVLFITGKTRIHKNPLVYGT